MFLKFVRYAKCVVEQKNGNYEKKIIMPFDSEVEANDYKNNNPTSKAN